MECGDTGPVTPVTRVERLSGQLCLDIHLVLPFLFVLLFTPMALACPLPHQGGPKTDSPINLFWTHPEASAMG